MATKPKLKAVEKTEPAQKKAARKPISINTPKKDMIKIMAEGNPDALKIIEKITHHQDLLHLDDMNIRGEQIRIGFKEHCGSNLESFIECYNSRDKEFVDTINEKTSSGEIAVTGGASKKRA